MALYPPPNPATYGSVYKSFQMLSGEQRSLVSQPQADNLYGTYMIQALNAGDFLSVLAFQTAWDQSQALLDPTINTRDTAPPYGGFSSQSWWNLRRASGDYIQQYRSAYDAYNRSVMEVTGGSTALEAQAAQDNLTTNTQVAAFNEALRQGQTVQEATATALAAPEGKPAPDDAWQLTPAYTGGQPSPVGTLYEIADFDGSDPGAPSVGVVQNVGIDAPGATLPGGYAPGPPQGTLTEAPVPISVADGVIVPNRPGATNVPNVLLWLAAAVVALVVLSRKDS